MNKQEEVLLSFSRKLRVRDSVSCLCFSVTSVVKFQRTMRIDETRAGPLDSQLTN
jgi:hypothetical protein